MRIAVQGDAVGIEGEHLVDCGIEAVEGLLRQTVDQVQAHRSEAGRACFFDHAPRHAFGLDAMHRLLHRRVEILYPDGNPVEAQFAEIRHHAWLDAARIDFNRAFAIGAAIELQIDGIAQGAHFFARQEAGRAAAPVHLTDALVASEGTPHQCDFLLEVRDVPR